MTQNSYADIILEASKQANEGKELSDQQKIRVLTNAVNESFTQLEAPYPILKFMN